jgi:hypothetical protein
MEQACAKAWRALRRSFLAGATISSLFWGDARAGDTIQLGGFELRGTGPSYVDLAAGIFDLFGETGGHRAAVGRIELRLGEKLFFVGPAVGVLANTEGGVFGYAGLYADIAYGRLVVTPLAAVGAYDQGNSKDLGGTFQFRVGLGFAYEFDDQSRLGIRLDHISNANLHEENPGEEELLLSYSIPIGSLFARQQ